MTGRGAAGPAKRGRYHHGDLRQALIETAIEMLGERGAEAFSMAEASRRLGVAASAPYRHFADRDALLAAVAVRAAGLLAAAGRSGESLGFITIRTAYPYQTLQQVPENAELPAFSLWVAYVPEDAEQRTNHVYGLLMIKKPPIPGALHLAWPFIRRFTERVFAEDRMAVEAEQRAWDEQGEDWNHEVFPLILEVRNVLRTNGVPIRPESARCGAAALCASSPRVGATTHAEPSQPA